LEKNFSEIVEERPAVVRRLGLPLQRNSRVLLEVVALSAE
jgi:hypothetical protein